jgi:type IV pilus assembly protein PilM
MFRLGRHGRPISLDIGRDSVKMLQLNSSGGAIAAAASRALPCDARDANLASLLSTMLAEAPFSGRNVNVALPHEIVHIRTVRLPHLPLDPLEALRADASDLFPFDLHDATVRFLWAGPAQHAGADCRQVIALAARTQDLKQLIEQLHSAGLKADRPDLPHAVLDLGGSRSTLVIGRGSEITFVRAMEIGGSHFERAVAQKLSLEQDEVRQLRRRLARTQSGPALRSNPVASAVFDATRGLLEELARQVAMCFRYHAITFRGQRPASLQLSGGQSFDPHLQHALSCAASLPVETIQPLRDLDAGIMRPADREEPAGQWGVCVGLARLHDAQIFHSTLGQVRPLRAVA